MPFFVRQAIVARLCRWLLLLAVVVAVAGCAGREKRKKGPEIPPGPIVRDVELEGVEYFEEDEFVSHLNLQPTPVITFGAKYYYVPGLERIDEQRIIDLYAAHGHYDAVVDDITVEVETKGCPKAHARKVARRERRGKPPPKPLKQIARVEIAVTEGEPARVRSRRIDWSPYDERGVDLDEPKVEAEARLAKGKVFEIPALTESSEQMTRSLRKEGFAHADVDEQAEVHTDEKWADVHYQVQPGTAVDIGEIRIEGLDLVPADLVAREFEFAHGERYSPRLIEKIEQSVYAMEVFSAVSVVEGPPKEDGTIDLIVRVEEVKLQSLKVGVGLGVDPVRWEQRATFRYRHDSIFGRLTRMDVDLKVGYAELPALYNPEQHGPVASLELTFRKKGLLEDKLVWTEKPGIELGIWDGYQFWTIKNRVGVSRFFSQYFELGLSYNNRFTDFFNVAPALNTNNTLLGRDFRDPYFLSFVGVDATVHLVDNMVKPKNGGRLKLGYDIANRFVGSQFNFHRIPIELQLFYRPHHRVQLLGRAKVGFIIPYGREQNRGVPIDQKWYLGGAYTVRGWPLRELSPRVEGECNAMGENCEQIPIGGKTLVLFNLEPQVRLWKDLWAGVFVDAGDNRQDIAQFDPSGWQASTGGGLRYESPIGTIRLDFGWRLTRDDRRFPVDSRFLPGDENYAFHLAIGDVF